MKEILAVEILVHNLAKYRGLIFLKMMLALISSSKLKDVYLNFQMSTVKNERIYNTIWSHVLT